MVRNCQVCGGPIFSRDNLGTNEDGTYNRDFCSDCFRDGEFTVRQDRGQNCTGLINYAYVYPFTLGGTGNVTQPFFPQAFVGNMDNVDDY